MRCVGPPLPVELTVMEQTLIDKGGCLPSAARALNMPSAELRRIVAATPSLADSIFEQIEQHIDAAVQTLVDGLASDNAMTRIRAAAYILRHTEAGRRRGWGPRGSARAEPVEPQTVTLKWID